MRIGEIESLEQLDAMKAQYVRLATAPLDGMWLCGFVPQARHFGFFEKDCLVGYFCVNNDGYILQFFVDEAYGAQATALFESIFSATENVQLNLNGAFVSTAEPHWFSLCLDRFSTFEVNALMYQHRQATGDQEDVSAFHLVPVKPGQLSEAVELAVAAIGAPESWLEGYFANLIQRGELFGVWQRGRLIATGESRGYDHYQTQYADVGMIVAKSERGRGIATNILRKLVAINDTNGLKSICSTERSNVAAQTAISRAGFVAFNRLVQFHA